MGGSGEIPHSLTASLAAFVRLLRTNGVTVGPGEAADALRAMTLSDLLDRREVYFLLRTTLVRQVDHYPVFDHLFRSFWRDAAGAPPEPQSDEEKEPVPAEPGTPSVTEAPGETKPPDGGMPGDGKADDDTLVRSAGSNGRPADDPGDEEAEGSPLHDMYSPSEGLLTRDVGTVPPEEAARLRRLAERLARHLATRLARRLRSSLRGERVDLRRSLRQGMTYGGDPLRLQRRRRRVRKPQLVLLCDVSGSMGIYAGILLAFVHALQSRLSNVESFVFATHLTRITPLLRDRTADRVLAGLPALARGWGGGTRTGDCLGEFNRAYGLRLLGRRSVVMIFSDGIDTGATEVLRQEMARLHRQAGRILWLNPMAGDARYEPRTEGMQAVLPYLDLLAPAHSLESLMRLERYLADRGRASRR